jgi:hypothetical protein
MTVSVLCVSLPLLRTRIVPWLRKGSLGLFSMEGYRLTLSCPYLSPQQSSDLSRLVNHVLSPDASRSVRGR